MKEATGELSMTVVVIIAVIAILGILGNFLLPKMEQYIKDTWGKFGSATEEADRYGGH